MRHFRTIALTLILCSAALSFGCEAHYRVYDPYRGDYHVWNHAEEGYYHRWAVDTHHNDQDFRKLKPEEQRQYFAWRHDQPEKHGN